MNVVLRWIVGLGLAAVLLVSACSMPIAVTTSGNIANVVSLTAQVVGESVSFSSGESTTGWPPYNGLANTKLSAGVQIGDITIDDGSVSGGSSYISNGVTVNIMPYRMLQALPLGNGYYMQFTGWHTGWIGNCISKNVGHYSWIINRSSAYGGGAPSFDLHLCAWRDGGGHRCIGLYESGTRACWSMCFPTAGELQGAYWMVVTAVAGFLIGLGIAYSVAWAIAYMLTPILIAIGVAA